MDTKKLRQKILDLAIHGKLVPQDPNDEPASVLLERIRIEKEQLIKEGKIKAPKKSKSAGDTSHYPKEGPWALPEGWVWTTIGEVFNLQAGKFVSAENIHEESAQYPYRCFGGNGIRGYVSVSNRIGDFPIIGRQGALCGNINFASGEFYATEHAVVVESFGGTDPTWARYLLEQLNLNQYATATAQPGLSVKTINEVEIPVPPIREQHEISNAISHYLAIIAGLHDTQEGFRAVIDQTKSRILDLAIHGKLVHQDPFDEPAIELLKRINPDFQPSHNLHYGESLPTGWVCATYGALNQHRNSSINPPDSPKEQYELYSVPIYETGYPEYLNGKEIGSTKQAVKKGEVLLCKINPHLNRAWVVEHYNPEIRCIASSEWLIFQSDALYPDYVRLFFMSPAFRSLMLSNVSGVGGSLMRARASAVDGYPIWVPPIDEQKRIVKVVKAYYKELDEIVAGLS